LLVTLTACNDSDRDQAKTDTLNSQPVDKNPKIEHDPTPDSGTSGDQQGTEPSQPAAKP
jgi:hypothetical protein